jgi:CarD family transcriptional regulator
VKGSSGAADSIPATKITRAEPGDAHRGGHGLGVPGADSGVSKTVVLPLLPGHVVGNSETKSSDRGAVFGDETPEEFQLGDKIVYPGHGVGEVEGVRATVLGGQEHRIYNIKIFHSGMKVMVPVAQSRAVGLRRIIDKRAIDQVYDILRMREVKIDLQTWNRRSREYAQKMKSGSPFEIAVVLRDLLILSVDKELSFSEKKMLDAAEALLVSEIAIARSRPHESIAGELRALFA